MGAHFEETERRVAGEMEYPAASADWVITACRSRKIFHRRGSLPKW
ncbi:MAG TPA: hypothetical protein PKW69_00735 [Niabella sp.]|nr:hypothetical protein [Niabella sp.]